MTVEAKRLYDPAAYKFDEEAPSYWRSSAPPRADLYQEYEGDYEVDFAIVGGGFTGLHAAYRLARTHGQEVALLEAGLPGWGASSRNGGFCCMGGAFSSIESLAKRYGEDEARRFERSQIDAVDHVRAFLDEHGIDAETHSDGEWELAHSPAIAKSFQDDAAHLAERLGRPVTVYPKEELRQLGMHGEGLHGAMHIPIGFGLHPGKYVNGLAEVALAHGARIYKNSEVVGMHKEGDKTVLTTAKGRLTARKVLIATNGYTAETMIDALRGTTLPLMSNILVTRPLSADERAAQCWTSYDMAFDTRLAIHYFRLMPNNRFLFGLRGGVDATDHGTARYEKQAREHFEAMFPAWRHVEHTHFWSGFVCLTRHLTPTAGPLSEDDDDIWVSLGYHGNGVAMASWLGAQTADMMVGAKSLDALPTVFRNPLSTFPLAPLRKHYLNLGLTGYKLYERLR